MSNKSQLQTNNNEVASLIEVLRGKSVGGEDVTAETDAYTSKIASLESAVVALENELAGKAGGGEPPIDGTIQMCTVTVIDEADFFANVYYLTLNGDYIEHLMDMTTPEDNPLEITDVLCNSYVMIDGYSGNNMLVTSSDGTSHIARVASTVIVFVGTSNTTITLPYEEDMGTGED